MEYGVCCLYHSFLSMCFLLLYVVVSLLMVGVVCGGIGERWFDSPMKG